MADASWTGYYLYDLAGRLATFQNANTPSATEPSNFIASNLYNARGQTTAITYGDGTSTTYSYQDSRGFLSRVLTQKSTATLLDLTYTRNAKGLITAIASPDTTRAWTYTYDGIDRLAFTIGAEKMMGRSVMLPPHGLPALRPRLPAIDGNAWRTIR